MRNYWWLRVTRDVGKYEYIDGCDICQRIKNRTEAPIRKLKLNKVWKRLWIHLMMDFITKLLLVAEKNAILVVCNRLSKITYFVKGTLVEGLVWLSRDNIWKLHRLLKSIVSDRELQFAVELTQELNEMLGIEIKLLTSFHSQTDRQTKYMN